MQHQAATAAFKIDFYKNTLQLYYIEKFPKNQLCNFRPSFLLETVNGARLRKITTSVFARVR
jgi:hypothetical protein